MPAIASADFIAEVEGAVRGGSPARRVQMLRQIMGLFLSDADRLSEHQIGIFDEVMVRLVEQVEPRTLAHLSMTLADLPSAPKEATRRLACHEEASIAAPVLRNSQSLSEVDLIEIANDCSQQHIFAIANRTKLSEALTDVVLARADTNVCRALARNPGTRFSDLGFLTLVAHAERDDDIADSLVLRPDTPATMLRELLAKATRAVRARLLKLAPPETRAAIEQAIASIETQASGKPRAPIDYSEAKSLVLALNNDGKLNDSTVNRFAVRQEHRNLIAALSLLATVEIEIIEPLIEESDGCGLMIACRASRLNWHTALAVISHRKSARLLSQQEIEQCQEAFEALPLSVAQRAIRFGSVRDIAAKFNSTESTSNAAGPRL
jgi:uncharacterized protein (DUF2336 family)